MVIFTGQRVRSRVRFFIFAMSALALSPLITHDALTQLFFAMSPYLAFSRMTATASWTFWMGIAAVFVMLVFLRRRFFCRYICPTGYLLEKCGAWKKRDPRRGSRIPIIARPLAWLCLGSMVGGYPFFLWLDPLSMLGGLGGVYRLYRDPLAWAVATPLLLLVLGTMLYPRVWCGRLCPLGGLQDLLADGRRAFQRMATNGNEPEQRARRAFLVLLAGLPVSLGMRHGRAATKAIRPPGAADEEVFNGLCSRCGRCSSVCPQRIVQPDLGTTGLAGLLTPVLSFRSGYCDEWCERCTRVCPTGALRPLTVEQKQAHPLGLATIVHPRCLAWGEQKHCVVCQEFCPYHAIALIDQGGVPCPVVDADRCRGCGACEKECPVLGGKAIVVKAVVA